MIGAKIKGFIEVLHIQNLAALRIIRVNKRAVHSVAPQQGLGVRD